MNYPDPPLYIDQQHRLVQELRGLRQSQTLPAGCQSGHLFVPHIPGTGTLICERCMMIPFGVLKEAADGQSR